MKDKRKEFRSAQQLRLSTPLIAPEWSLWTTSWINQRAFTLSRGSTKARGAFRQQDITAWSSPSSNSISGTTADGGNEKERETSKLLSSSCWPLGRFLGFTPETFWNISVENAWAVAISGKNQFHVSSYGNKRCCKYCGFPFCPTN